MTLSAVENEQRRARQIHARLLVDIAVDPAEATRYDLSPAGAGLELQQQVIVALAALPFLAGAEVSVQVHDERDLAEQVDPEPQPASPLGRTDGELAPDDFPRLRGRMFAEAADALAWVWRGDTAKEQIKFLREMAHRASLANPDARLDPAVDRDGSRRQQFVEFLAVANPERLRRMALGLVDQNVALRRAASHSDERANTAELRAQVLTVALSKAERP